MIHSPKPEIAGYFAKLKKNPLIQAGFWLTLANLMAGVLGYVYQVLIGRMLIPGEFALFSAVLALFVFFASPFNAMSQVILRRVSTLRGQGLQDTLRQLYAWTTLRLGIFVLLLLIVVVVFQQHLQGWLNTDLLLPVWFFFIIMAFNAYYLINNAFFQGIQRFDLLGILTLTSVLLKIILSVAFIYWGFNITGALSGVSVSLVLSWFTGFVLLRQLLPPVKNKPAHIFDSFPIASTLPVLIANIAFAAMTQLDMVLVNNLFAANDAGAYAAASVLGKAVLYIPGGLVLALFPLVAEGHAQNKNSYPMLIQALLVSFLLCGFVALVYWLFADNIILLLYGEAYVGADVLLKWYGFAILPMALVLVAEYFMIAKGEVLFTWLFLAMSPIQIFLMLFWHDHLWQIIVIMGGCGTALLLTGFYMLLRRYLKTENYYA